jgi:hypothetical protein
MAPTSATTANRPVVDKPKEKKKVQEKPINLPDPPEIIVDEQGTRWARGKLLGSVSMTACVSTKERQLTFVLSFLAGRLRASVRCSECSRRDEGIQGHCKEASAVEEGSVEGE